MAVGLVTGFTQSASKPGLRVTINAGDAVISGSVAHFSVGDISVPANALSYIYLNFSSGLIETSTSGFLAGSWPICTVQTNATDVSTLSDSRPDAFGGGGGGSSGAVLLAPSADQTIAGSHGLILSDVANPNFGVELVIDPVGSLSPIEVHSGFANGANFYTHATQTFRAPAISLFTSRGTRLSPAAVTGAIGYLSFGGYDTSAYALGAQFEVSTGATWSPTNHSCSLDVLTVPAGSTAIGIVFRFGSNPDNGGDTNGNVSLIDLGISSGQVLKWVTGQLITADSGISRLGAASLAIGNGTNADVSGTLGVTNINAASGGTLSFGTIGANPISLSMTSGLLSVVDVFSSGANGFRAAASAYFFWNGRSSLRSLADGNIVLRNAADTSFGLLQLGGVTSAFPALKRSSAGLISRLADDSADTTMEVSGLIATAAAPTVAAAQIGYGSTTATTASAGAQAAPPATVDGYIIVNIAGTGKKIPYYAT